MSENKKKYWLVETTQVVSANNKTDAIAAAQRKRGVDAKVLSTTHNADRIAAITAQEYVS